MENTFYSIEIAQQLGTNEQQEDAVGCVLGDMSALLILCDGMGGLNRGALAAETAVATIKSLSKKMDWEQNPIEFMSRAIRLADEEVYHLRDENDERIKGGCTLIMALLIGRNLYYANVGDSRIYIYEEKEIRQLTQDHNYGEMLKRRFQQGKISEEELKAEWGRAAALTSYIGMGEIKEAFISSQPIKLNRDSVVLLQSDGLYKLVSDDEIRQIVENNSRDLERVMTKLFEQAYHNKRNYQDNTSVMLLRMK